MLKPLFLLYLGYPHSELGAKLVHNLSFFVHVRPPKTLRLPYERSCSCWKSPLSTFKKNGFLSLFFWGHCIAVRVAKTIVCIRVFANWKRRNKKMAQKLRVFGQTTADALLWRLRPCSCSYQSGLAQFWCTSAGPWMLKPLFLLYLGNPPLWARRKSCARFLFFVARPSFQNLQIHIRTFMFMLEIPPISFKKNGFLSLCGARYGRKDCENHCL